MPNHCMKAVIGVSSPMNADFTVKFNPEVKPNTLTYTTEDINSEEKTSELLCDL